MWNILYSFTLVPGRRGNRLGIIQTSVGILTGSHLPLAFDKHQISLSLSLKWGSHFHLVGLLFGTLVLQKCLRAHSRCSKSQPMKMGRARASASVRLLKRTCLREADFCPYIRGSKGKLLENLEFLWQSSMGSFRTM